MLPFIFVAVAAIMTMIAHGVAQRFSRFPALDAYRLDILGSLAGIVSFAALTTFRIQPIGWMLVIAALIVILTWRPRAMDLVACAGLLVVAGRLQRRRHPDVVAVLPGPVLPGRQAISVNGIPHQAMVDINEPNYQIYQRPYERFTGNLGNVLIVGAGNGNDVAAALEAGAQHVDAVEIDPVLQDLGAQYHPLNPYADPRVTRITNDGRAYLQQTDTHYDLIIFALPDSLTLVSGQSAVRLESFLFTEEAMQAARDHLNPGGAFSMYNFYREPWLLDRLGGTLAGRVRPSAVPRSRRAGTDAGGHVLDAHRRARRRPTSIAMRRGRRPARSWRRRPTTGRSST